MDILDDKRIEAITPLFEYYGIQDVICVLREQLLLIRQQQEIDEKNYEFTINGWEVKFGESFDNLCIDTKLMLIDKIQHEYPNFDDIIIERTQREFLDFCIYYDYDSEIDMDKSWMLRFNSLKMYKDKLEFDIVSHVTDIYERQNSNRLTGFTIEWEF